MLMWKVWGGKPEEITSPPGAPVKQSQTEHCWVRLTTMRYWFGKKFAPVNAWWLTTAVLFLNFTHVTTWRKCYNSDIKIYGSFPSLYAVFFPIFSLAWVTNSWLNLHTQSSHCIFIWPSLDECILLMPKWTWNSDKALTFLDICFLDCST